MTLAQLRARRIELDREASRRPQEERRLYQERIAEIMRLEAREIADMRGSETPEKSPVRG